MSVELLTGLLSGIVGYALGTREAPTEREVIDFLRQNKPEFVRTVTIDTSQAHDKEPYNIAGIFIAVENPDTPTTSVEIRLNEPEAYPMDLTKERRIQAPFYRFFISNTAGAGTLTLVIGKAYAFEVVEAVSNIKITAQSVNVDIEVAGSDIQMPIDLQGSYIQMPIDIQSQYIDLDVNIKSQTANVNINIAAQTIGNINVNIAASAVTMNITGSVSITGTPSVTISGTPSVTITSGSVTATVSGSVSITGTPTVTISSGTVSISGTVTVSISGTANIDIKAQSVGVSIQGEWQAIQGTSKHFDSFAEDQARQDYTTAHYQVTSGKTFYLTQFAGAIHASAAADSDKHQICYGWVQVGAAYPFRLGGQGGFSLSIAQPIKVGSEVHIYVGIQNVSNHDCTLACSFGGYEV